MDDIEFDIADSEDDGEEEEAEAEEEGEDEEAGAKTSCRQARTGYILDTFRIILYHMCSLACIYKYVYISRTFHVNIELLWLCFLFNLFLSS